MLASAKVLGQQWIQSTRSLPTIRLQIAGIIDQYFRVTSALHDHTDFTLGYDPACDMCRRSEDLIMQAVNVTDPRLTQLSYRDNTTWDV